MGNSTNFVFQVTVIPSPWANDVNSVIYNLLGPANGNAPTTRAQIIANLGISGGGTVTHSLGPLTSGNLTVGNGSADLAASKVALTQPATAGTLVFGTDNATITLQGTDTYLGRATTDTLTNKTYDTGGTGNSFKIAGTAITATTGTGSVVLATSPSISAPTITSHPTIEGVTSTGAQGTGAFVFATSPTLTTPVIGTATGTSLSVTGALTAFSGTAPPAGGTAGDGLLFSSTANTGIFFGSGAPTLSAGQGSIYIRTDGTTCYVNQNGSTSWVALTSGGGTVSNSGALTSNAIITGAGGTTVQALGSLGTTTTLLHGNASGAPSFGAVVLTTDVSGILPGANGGTGVANTGFTITLAGNLVTTGSFNTTFAAGASVTHTLPTATSTLAALNIADQVVSGGATVTSYSLGTLSSGTTTIDCGKCPLQYFTNGGAFTLAAPANDGSCVLYQLNNGSAGTITFSGFTVGANTGDSLTTTNGSKFKIYINMVNSVASYTIQALQ